MFQRQRKQTDRVAPSATRRRRAAHTWAASVERLEPRQMLSASVLSYHNDPASDGQNTQETVLTPSNVNSTSFGKLFTASVDGNVFAQPLFMPGLTIAGGVHNVLFVATEHDSVYALDGGTGAVLWHVSFLKTGLLGATSITTVPSADVFLNQPHDITPEIGTTSTPVIDSSTNTLYVTATTKEIVGGVAHYVQRLHALDVLTGKEKLSGPVILGDTTFVNGVYTNNSPIWVNGTGDGTDGQGHVFFNALRELQRVALTLANGQLYIGWGSYGDISPFHGWIAAFNPATLALTGVFNATPNGSDGSFWMSGGKFSTDGSGDIYAMTGNGAFDGSNSTGTVTGLNAAGFPVNGDYGDSFLKIAVDTVHNSPTKQNVNGWGLKVVDYFTPFNQAFLNSHDRDLGSGGILVLPDAAGDAAHPHLLVGGGKQGVMYLLDRDNLGKFSASQKAEISRIVEETGSSTLAGGAFSTPAYFNQSLFYVSARTTGVRARDFSLPDGSARINPTAASLSPDKYMFPGSTPSVSANGTTNGIIWDIDLSTNQLRAYNATGYDQELYTSAQAANNRDALGSAIRFTVPSVVDGEVYVGTTNSIVAYGLLNASQAAAPVNSAQIKSESQAVSSGPGSPNIVNDPPMPDTLAPIREAQNQSLVSGSGLPIGLDNFSAHPQVGTPIQSGDLSDVHAPGSSIDWAPVGQGVDPDPARRLDWSFPPLRVRG